MRIRSLKKQHHALSWRRNQYSLILSDELTALVLADAERQIAAVSVVVRGIVAEHYQRLGRLPGGPPEPRINAYNGR